MMADYSIFTICSKNYRDAYDFVINSWLNTTTKKIYVYTDDKDWKSDNDRIEIVLFLNKEKNWNKIVKFKTKVFKEFSKKKIPYSIFVDMDCYLLDDIGDVFKKDFDFAITRLNTPQIAVSTGIVYIKYSNKMSLFYDEWEIYETNLEKTRKPKERTCSNNQQTFSDLIRSSYKSKKLKIHDIDVNVYNRKAKPGRIKDLIKQKKEGKKIKVLHFYNTSYRNEDYVNQMVKEFKI